MNEAGDDRGGADTGPDQDPRDEPVGNVSDEAAKLLGAISDWAREQGSDYAGSATGAAGAFTSAVQDVSEHFATGGEDCRYCPVCRVVHAVRGTSPEVKAHLSVAASSLMHAAAGLLATHAPGEHRGQPVEKIDLDAGADWDEDQ